MFKSKNLSRSIVWIVAVFLFLILIAAVALLNMQDTSREGETNFGGEIAGLSCPCICCVPERE